MQNKSPAKTSSTTAIKRISKARTAAEPCCSGSSSCCGSPVKEGPLSTPVSTKLTFKDITGSWKARWSINRMNFTVDPGLYSVNEPDADSPVLVTANYKMSFDALRKELSGISAWLLVLDTKGINVWCAAGKGTFGTEELISRIETSGLSEVVEHRTLILPQLGAVGVSAHVVQKRSGFKVVYGPVRAEDLPAFLKNGMQADKKMRTVRFNFYDRAVLTPVELVSTLKPSLMIFGAMFLLNLIGLTRFTGMDVVLFIAAVLSGCVLTPMLLPWIPGRAFALKGWFLGLILTAGVTWLNGSIAGNGFGILTPIAHLLILPSISAFLAMNFTGCSTYTSYSGVIKEMKIAIPLIAVSIAMGIILLIAGNLLSV